MRAQRANMVNRLLTISIKVNIARLPNRIFATKGREKMKKTKAGRGLWSYLCGSGWGGGGGNG
jgi:hypothetical protein